MSTLCQPLHRLGYTILPRMVVMSSFEKARSVWVRTLPSVPRLNPRVVTAMSSGDSTTADIVGAEGPVKFLHRGAGLLRHIPKRIGALGRVFDVANALLGEIRQDDVGRHCGPPGYPPAHP